MNARALLALTAAAGAIVLSAQALRWRAANGSETAAVARLERTAEDAATLVSLNASSERIALAERPPQDLIARLGAAITECGLNATLDGVQPESSAPIRSSAGGASEPQHRRQSARATLRNMTLEDLGRLLAHWRRTQTLWSITNITLTHDGSQDPRGLYRAELTLAATYLHDGSSP